MYFGCSENHGLKLCAYVFKLEELKKRVPYFQTKRACENFSAQRNRGVCAKDIY
jgi:hypothetical protein